MAEKYAATDAYMEQAREKLRNCGNLSIAAELKH